MSSYFEGFISSSSHSAVMEFIKTKVFRSDSGFYVVDAAFSAKKCRDNGGYRICKCAFVAMHQPANASLSGSEQITAEIVRYYTRREARGRYYIYVESTPEEWGLSHPSDAETDCPEWFLRLLTPTDDENALRWRAACRAKLVK